VRTVPQLHYFEEKQSGSRWTFFSFLYFSFLFFRSEYGYTTCACTRVLEGTANLKKKDTQILNHAKGHHYLHQISIKMKRVCFIQIIPRQENHT
jgi:hypothetical protein